MTLTSLLFIVLNANKDPKITPTFLSIWQKGLLAIISFLIVAFGQPAWNGWVGIAAALFGYALFFRVLLEYKDHYRRFWLGTLWFTSVQIVQLSWFASHPYLYIYPIYFFFAAIIGIQFGFLALCITVKSIQRLLNIVAIASLWTLFEWSRLFFLSGYSWNPAGMALTGLVYPLQMASLWGIFGLSFWVMLTNLLMLKAWCQRWNPLPVTGWIFAAATPYLYGIAHFHLHHAAMARQQEAPFHAVLVHTAFPAEASMNFSNKNEMVAFSFQEWTQILQILQKHQGRSIDLIVLPEYAVLCGTYSCVFPYDIIKELFASTLGAEAIKQMPPLEQPLARTFQTSQGTHYFVNNAFIAQSVANYFQAGMVVGLEDAEDDEWGERHYYSAAHYFKPVSDSKDLSGLVVERYEKRVLVPLGEYIPFKFCKALAASYGVQGSFTSGKEAKVFKTDKLPFGVSICYEETFGDLMRENRQQGAALLVNVTSDSWYPNSRLPMQHFTHARLRTVESGIPLIRASNIGITGIVDSLGQVVKILGEGEQQPEWRFDSLNFDVPRYHYWTLYTHTGDSLIIGICLFTLLCWTRRKG